jgi:hypothetical protein
MKKASVVRFEGVIRRRIALVARENTAYSGAWY